MKQKDVFNKIGGIIQELSDQYEYLKTVEGDLNDLELELFVSNAHFLTDHIEILCKLNMQNIKLKRPPMPKPEKAYEPKYFEPVVQQMKNANNFKDIKPPKPAEQPIEAEVIKPREEQPEPMVDIEPETPQIDLGSGTRSDTYSFIREEPETIRHELILDEADTWEDEEPLPVATEPLIAKEKEEPYVPEIMFEPVAADEPEELIEAETEETKPADDTPEEAEVLTVNQKIHAQFGDKAASKTDQLAIKPISDIKLAITLNDKLLYVKDLFNGYNLAYSEAIEILNRFNTFEEASRFLKTNYVTKNNWESKPATTEKFYNLLKRRYA